MEKSCDHEDNLKLHVKDVLEDIMGLTNISGLSASIEVFIETKKIRSDVLMFKLGGFLISICEVKKTPNIIYYCYIPTAYDAWSTHNIAITLFSLTYVCSY